MTLKVLLPFMVFAEESDVTRVVVETTAGSYGLLPNRLDCVAALTPGVLTYQTARSSETFVALDEGLMVKTGADVVVSSRRAVAGADLAGLKALVEKEFEALDADALDVRRASASLESGFLRRLGSLQNE